MRLVVQPDRQMPWRMGRSEKTTTNNNRHNKLQWVCAVTHHRFKDLEAPANYASNEHIALGDTVGAITIRYPLTMRGNAVDN